MGRILLHVVQTKHFLCQVLPSNYSYMRWINGLPVTVTSINLPEIPLLHSGQISVGSSGSGCGKA
jgi:hypothetical protein